MKRFVVLMGYVGFMCWVSQGKAWVPFNPTRPLDIVAQETLICTLDEPSQRAQCVAQGQATVSQETSFLQADTLTFVFEKQDSGPEKKEAQQSGSSQTLASMGSLFSQRRCSEIQGKGNVKAHSQEGYKGEGMRFLYKVQEKELTVWGPEMVISFPEHHVTASRQGIYDGQKNTVKIEGDVVWKHQGMILKCDTLMLTLNAPSAPKVTSRKQTLRKAYARSNVQMFFEDSQSVKADEATYYAAEHLIVLKGETVTLKRHESYLTGTYATVDTLSQKVTLYAQDPSNAQTGKQHQGIKGVIMPKELQKL